MIGAGRAGDERASGEICTTFGLAGDDGKRGRALQDRPGQRAKRKQGAGGGRTGDFRTMLSRAVTSRSGIFEITGVFACCLGAGAFYASNINARPLWSDELAQIITARRPFMDGLLQTQDYAAPLYQLLLRLLIDNDYPSEWVIRTPAVVFAVLGLLASWWFTKSLFGAKTGLVTAILLALNPVFVHYATQGRPYTMFVLFSVLSMGTFYSLVQRESLGNLVSYVLCTVLLVYSHYYGFLLLSAQAVYAAFNGVLSQTYRGYPRRIVLAFGAVSFFGLPALWLVSRYFARGLPGTVGWLEVPGITDLFVQPGCLLGLDDLGFFGVVPMLAVLFLKEWPCSQGPMGSSRVPRKIGIRHWWTSRAAGLLCLIWVAGSLYLLLVCSRLVRPIYCLRYSIPVIVPITILFVALIIRLRLAIQVAVFALFLFLILPGTLASSCARSGYPDLLAWLEKTNTNNSDVFVTDWAYCDGFINPEVHGLVYYGFPDDKIRLLPLRYPYQPAISNPEILPRDERIFVVSFVGTDLLREYFRSQPRAYRSVEFGHLEVFEVEEEGKQARWLQSAHP